MKQKQDFKLLAIAFILFVIFVVLAFIVLLGGDLLSGKNNTLDNASKPINSETGAETETNPAEIEKKNESSDVMLLLEKVPYNGSNFSLFYSYDGNFFTLYINPANPSAGNAEFDQFLKTNKIESRSWIYDLRTVSVKPTLEP